MTTAAEAPSDSWLVFPAVMHPPSITGFSPWRPAKVVSGRLPSSLVSVTLVKESAQPAFTW
jgi:hypothetical protein